jgi:hypothetical protein
VTRKKPAPRREPGVETVFSKDRALEIMLASTAARIRSDSLFRRERRWYLCCCFPSPRSRWERMGICSASQRRDIRVLRSKSHRTPTQLRRRQSMTRMSWSLRTARRSIRFRLSCYHHTRHRRWRRTARDRLRSQSVHVSCRTCIYRAVDRWTGGGIDRTACRGSLEIGFNAEDDRFSLPIVSRLRTPQEAVAA